MNPQDPRGRRDGFVFGMMTRLYFDPRHNQKGGVELEILRRHCRLPAPLFTQSVSRLEERGVIASRDRSVFQVTPSALQLIQNGWKGQAASR